MLCQFWDSLVVCFVDNFIQYNTTQHNTTTDETQHNTTQHNTTELLCILQSQLTDLQSNTLSHFSTQVQKWKNILTPIESQLQSLQSIQHKHNTLLKIFNTTDIKTLLPKTAEKFNTTQHNIQELFSTPLQNDHTTQQQKENTTQHKTKQNNTTQNNPTKHSTTQPNTTQHNPTQHNTTQHNITQHNTTQHKVLDFLSDTERVKKINLFLEQLEKCEKQLNVYLNHKKTFFPRFYLCSNNTILNLMSNQLQQHNTTQHNTTKQNTTKHNTTHHKNTTQRNTTQHNTTQHNTTVINNIYPNIHSLKLSNDNCCITAIESSNTYNETIQLHTPVVYSTLHTTISKTQHNTTLNRRKSSKIIKHNKTQHNTTQHNTTQHNIPNAIEEWMCELDREIKNTITFLINQSLESSDVLKIDWIRRFPLCVVCVVLCVVFVDSVAIQ